MRRRARATLEQLLFGHPQFYRLKFLLVERLIWGRLLGGVCGMKARPFPDLARFYSGKRVLLAACGPGNVTTGPALDAAADVVAFDLSAEFARACRENHPDWEVFEGDIAAIPYPAGAFDVVALYSALHHIALPAEQVLRELARVSRGHVVVVEGVVPPRGALRASLLAWYALVDGGVRYYTRGELERAFACAGLRAESVSVHGPIEHMLLAVLAKGAA